MPSHTGSCLTLGFITQLHQANDVFILVQFERLSGCLFSLIFLLCCAEKARSAFEPFTSLCSYTSERLFDITTETTAAVNLIVSVMLVCVGFIFFVASHTTKVRSLPYAFLMFYVTNKT